MKRNVIAIIAVISTLIITSLIVAIILLNSDKILRNFSIVSVENVSTNFVVKFERVKAAVHYDVAVYNDKNIQIYSKIIEDTTANLELSMLQYDYEYKIIVYAYDQLGDSRAVNNPYTFRYTEPTFCEENSLILTDEEDYTLVINGDLKKKDYKIRLSSGGETLLEENLTTNEYKIKESLFTEKEIKLDVEIFDGKISINTISLFNNMSPIGDITITNPANGNTIDYNDVTITYTGGENATDFMIQIFQGRTLIREREIRTNRVVIASEIFEKAESYRVVITAMYEDYEAYNKTATVEFTMNEKDTLKPAYLNLYHRYVRSGSQLILSNPNEEGNIYFTTDGSDPTTNGTKYTQPIVARSNMTLRTVVMEPLMNNSVISEFPINVGRKANFSVYLSPSNQDRNFGVRSTGYTNEMREMNHLTNYIESRLKDNGIRVFRNSPFGNISLWTSDSRFYGVDLHLAIHSNASARRDQFGPEVWINEQTSITYSLANLFQNALMSIYYNDDPVANRGVKYALGALGEVNELAVPFGILVEVGFHDHELDAAWIMQNKELIGNTLADVILKYFGII